MRATERPLTGYVKGNDMAKMCTSDYRFIGVSDIGSLNWHSFKFAADIDYVSFFMQYHIGILSIGTVAWMMQQCIEKYCKAILNKSDPSKFSDSVLAKAPYSHNLINLWEEVKKNTVQFSYEKAYEDFISEVNEITTHSRYMSYSMGFNLGLIETFTVFGCEFRYEILGAKEFHDRFFGMQQNLILPRMFLNGYSFENLFRKLMHFSIEHGYSFSGMGIPDTYEWTKVGLSEATSKFYQGGKHKNIEKDCPVCNKSIWADGNRSSNDGLILRKYLGINT